MHLKVCPEKVKTKSTLKLLSNSLDKNPGSCKKGSAMGWDVKDRKMQLSKAMDSTSELQGVKLKEINEGSCKTKRVRCPKASTLPNDPIIKAVNPSFKKYPKHLGIKGALCLKEHLSMFLNWPESVRKKRSSSGHIQLSDTPENTLGSICLGKRHKRGKENFGSVFTRSLPEEIVEEILSRLPVKSVARIRYESGTFYPEGADGSHTMTGEGPGAGYNINVPWENDSCGDADYLAVWDHVLIPVAEKFDPELIMISAGFDAALGDLLGECCVTPHGFALMLSKLMRFATGGKIVMALEGGYNLESIANSARACIEVLLGKEPTPKSSTEYPFQSTWEVIKKVRNELKRFWPVLDKELPDELLSKHIPYRKVDPKSILAAVETDFTVIVEMLNGETTTLQLSLGDTVMEVRQRLQDILGNDEFFTSYDLFLHDMKNDSVHCLAQYETISAVLDIFARDF